MFWWLAFDGGVMQGHDPIRHNVLFWVGGIFGGVRHFFGICYSLCFKAVLKQQNLTSLI